MNESVESLCTELRLSREELLQKLKFKQGSQKILPYVEQELADIERTLAKLENGEFGKCELSGEILPEGLVLMIPTLKTFDDAERVGRYFRKPIYS